MLNSVLFESGEGRDKTTFHVIVKNFSLFFLVHILASRFKMKTLNTLLRI